MSIGIRAREDLKMVVSWRNKVAPASIAAAPRIDGNHGQSRGQSAISRQFAEQLEKPSAAL
jgi:hypothetical protein